MIEGPLGTSPGWGHPETQVCSRGCPNEASPSPNPKMLPGSGVAQPREEERAFGVSRGVLPAATGPCCLGGVGGVQGRVLGWGEGGAEAWQLLSAPLIDRLPSGD